MAKDNIIKLGTLPPKYEDKELLFYAINDIKSRLRKLKPFTSAVLSVNYKKYELYVEVIKYFDGNERREWFDEKAKKDFEVTIAFIKRDYSLD